MTLQHWWVPYKRNVTSQDGEDGVLERIFELLPATDRWCVEFGAADGEYLSNTWKLIVKDGWSAVLIERDRRRFRELRKRYADYPGVFAFCRTVALSGGNTLQDVMRETPLPKRFALLSIDIDGNDYHIWDALTDYEPEVVVIEYNPMIPMDIEFVQPPEPTVHQGSSLLSLTELGTRKGYELVAATACNGFFVRAEHYPLFGLHDNSPKALRDNKKYETRVFQLYDGTLKIAGYRKLFWLDLPIEERRVQTLTRSLRRYPDSGGNPLLGWLHRAYLRMRHAQPRGYRGSS